jgi:flagellar biogenesis protein FliO
MWKKLLPLFLVGACGIYAAAPEAIAEAISGTEGSFGDDSSRFMNAFTHMLQILAIMVGALFLIAYIAKRFTSSRLQHSNTLSQIKVLEKRGLSVRTSLYLVEIDGQKAALAESQNGVTLLWSENRDNLKNTLS